MNFSLLPFIALFSIVFKPGRNKSGAASIHLASMIRSQPEKEAIIYVFTFNPCNHLRDRYYYPTL